MADHDGLIEPMPLFARRIYVMAKEVCVMNRLVLAAVAALMAAPATADSFAPVTDQQEFLSLIDGKQLRNYLYGITLQVGEGGSISGSAVGWDVTGTWSWQNGYFCREMNWGGDVIPYNCQLVEARGNDRIRFTVDQGAGDSATFRLQ